VKTPEGLYHLKFLFHKAFHLFPQDQTEGGGMDEKRVEEWAVKWIGENLDPRRWCYHHLGHVRDVVADAAEFGRLSGLPESELSLLRAAGWLHDTGYAIDPANHEEASARKAQEALPQSEKLKHFTVYRLLPDNTGATVE